jgi:hypothetical protein
VPNAGDLVAMETYSLTYVSKLVSAPITDCGFVELLDRSRRRNAVLHVTGMLLKLDDHFLQLLEGREADVRQLFRRISCDARHQILGIIEEAPAPHRLFADWPMGFRDLNRVSSIGGAEAPRGRSLAGADLTCNPQLCHDLLSKMHSIMCFAPRTFSPTAQRNGNHQNQPAPR